MKLDLLKLGYVCKNRDKYFGTYCEKQGYTILGYENVPRKKDKYNDKLYDIYCPVCADDEEMFGNGVFKSFKSIINRDGNACGCGKNFRYSDPQRELLTKRKAKKLDVRFIRILGSTYQRFSMNNLKIVLSCSKHGEYESKYETFMAKVSKGTCPGCSKDSYASKTLTFEENLDKVKQTGKFLEGTEFKQTDEFRDTLNDPEYRVWGYVCPKCSNDEYVINGLCSGVFKNTIIKMKLGNLSCRCSSNPSWTKEQYEYRISNIQKDCTFVRWVDKFKDCSTSIVMKHDNCDRNFKVSLGSWLHSESSCPFCANKGAKHFYLNLISDSSTSLPLAIKIGISKNYKKRLAELNRRSPHTVSNILTVGFFSYELCKDFEAFIKNKYKLNYLTNKDLSCGYTETGCTSLLEDIYKDILWSDYSEIINKSVWGE